MRVTGVPKTVRKYMEEFEENEQDTRSYILRQLQYYAEVPDKASSTPEQWLGFKLGCSSAAAATAIKWARQVVTKPKPNAEG